MDEPVDETADYYQKTEALDVGRSLDEIADHRDDFKAALYLLEGDWHCEECLVD